MLTGKESLIRLIGKRRRYLPHRQSLLSSPIQSSLNLCTDKNSKIVLNKTGDPVAFPLVTCPICGTDVPGDDYTINSHLDACLSRGTKRKLTQRTLLQLNFSAQTKVQDHSNETKISGINVFPECPVESFVQNAICGLPNFVAVEENDSIHCRSPLKLESSKQTYMGASTENNISYQSIDCKDRIPSSSPNNYVPKHDMDVTIDDISKSTLQTFIVGRRYSDEKEISIGAGISLSRDPHNAKDPNAIKVISEDSGCCKLLGYLPKELSQYLSPLIDKFSPSFECCLISAPKHSLDVVPIKITYYKIISDAEKDDIEVSKCLWEKALCVARSAKSYPSCTIKYLHNFNLLIQEALRSNPYLFTNDEKIFLESFNALSEDSQRLFVRIYMRKGPWFRLSNISYPEVSDSVEAVKELSASGYICLFEGTNELLEDMKGICSLLTVSELHEISCVLKKNCNRGSRKQNLIASLLCSYENGLCPKLPRMVLDRTGVCIRLSLKAESVIWRAEAIELAQIMDESLDENNIELVLRCILVADSRISSSSCRVIQSTTSKLTNTFHSYFSASWVYSKVLSLGISFLEHEHRYSDAVNLLRRLLACFACDGRRGYWTLRLSVDLEHVGCLNESLSVAEDGLLDPWVRAGPRVALQRRVLRLGKPPRRWKIPSFSESIQKKITEINVQGRPLNYETGMKSRFYGEEGEQCGVEQLALQYYAGEGGEWQGVHTESGIWLTIFGLLLWDILFSDVPNVFRTRFQTAPLDLDSDSFYLVRKDHIEFQLQKIHDGVAEEIIITSWESHVGTACRGVNWDRYSLSTLRAAVTCIGGPCLASLCRHLAQDYRSWSSGMPDLLLWRFHDEYRGEAKLVEVKGPRDRLSEQQRAWLLLLMDSGFNVEVCKVGPTSVSS